MTILLQLLLVASWPGFEVNPKSCGLIAIGMTKDEVKAIMKIPDGDYRLTGKGPTEQDRLLYLSGRGLLALKDCQLSWVSDFGAIGVNFNEHDRVRSIRITSIDTATIPDEWRVQYGFLLKLLSGKEAEK